jgi:hypothetical protein
MIKALSGGLQVCRYGGIVRIWREAARRMVVDVRLDSSPTLVQISSSTSGFLPHAQCLTSVSIRSNILLALHESEESSLQPYCPRTYHAYCTVAVLYHS